MPKSNEIKQVATFINSIDGLSNAELKTEFEKLPANVQNKLKYAVRMILIKRSNPSLPTKE